MLPPRLRFGAFIAPFHPVGENPSLALSRDFELVEWMDRLGSVGNALNQEVQKHLADVERRRREPEA